MRYRLRTLLIVLAIGPPVLAWGGLFGRNLTKWWADWVAVYDEPRPFAFTELATIAAVVLTGCWIWFVLRLPISIEDTATSPTVDADNEPKITDNN
ncbi:MAG TPA: hypothetical protein VGI40_16165 [Pirellulaceae bacterium]|jgi:hypothetical protein